MPGDAVQDGESPGADAANAQSGARKPGRSQSAKRSTQGIPQGLNRVVAVGSAVATLSWLLNDVLIPNTWVVSGVVLVISIAGLLVTRLPAASIPKWPGRQYLIGRERRTTRNAFVAAAVIAVVAVGVQRFAPPGGVIAAALPAVHDWQVEQGIIAADVAAIKDALKNVKQETSDDPRKELANLGVPWTTQAFVDALKLNDERIVRLFLDGGMSPTADNKGAAAVVYILQPNLPVSAVPMLTLLTQKGFDLDTILVDDYILPNPEDPTSIFPPQWENQDPYLLVTKGHFAGPAMLWVVIESTWYGPTAHDLETLHFLIDHGADRTIAMKYMDFAATWNDTPAYDTVLALLKG